VLAHALRQRGGERQLRRRAGLLRHACQRGAGASEITAFRLQRSRGNREARRIDTCAFEQRGQRLFARAGFGLQRRQRAACGKVLRACREDLLQQCGRFGRSASGSARLCAERCTTGASLAAAAVTGFGVSTAAVSRGLKLAGLRASAVCAARGAGFEATRGATAGATVGAAVGETDGAAGASTIAEVTLVAGDCGGVTAAVAAVAICATGVGGVVVACAVAAVAAGMADATTADLNCVAPSGARTKRA
jgi:hypothetical protein